MLLASPRPRSTRCSSRPSVGSLEPRWVRQLRRQPGAVRARTRGGASRRPAPGRSPAPVPAPTRCAGARPGGCRSPPTGPRSCSTGCRSASRCCGPTAGPWSRRSAPPSGRTRPTSTSCCPATGSTTPASTRPASTAPPTTPRRSPLLADDPAEPGDVRRGHQRLRARPGQAAPDARADRDGRPRRRAGPEPPSPDPARWWCSSTAGTPTATTRPTRTRRVGVAVPGAAGGDPQPPRLRLHPAGARLPGLRDGLDPRQRHQRPGLPARRRRRRRPRRDRAAAPRPLDRRSRPTTRSTCPGWCSSVTAAAARASTAPRSRSRSTRRTASSGRCCSRRPTSARRPRRTSRP